MEMPVQGVKACPLLGLAEKQEHLFLPLGEDFFLDKAYCSKQTCKVKGAWL